MPASRFREVRHVPGAKFHLSDLMRLVRPSTWSVTRSPFTPTAQPIPDFESFVRTPGT